MTATGHPTPQLTQEQQQLIAHGNGKAVVFAIAGSGKTTTVANRIKRLITQAGIKADEILAVTFTNEAVRQFLESLTECGCPDIASIQVLTFHKLAGRILREAEKYGFIKSHHSRQSKKSGRQIVEEAIHSYQRGDLIYPLQTNTIAYSFIHQQLRSKIDWHLLDEILEASTQLKQVMLTTSYILNNLVPIQARDFYTPSSPNSARPYLEHILNIYEIYRRSIGFREFQDVINDAVEVMAFSQEFAQLIATTYKHITVDEFQDVDPSQNCLLEQVAQNADSLVIVGDDDQAIYQWRGAQAAFLTEKLNQEDWQTFTLQSNFRCPAKITSLSSYLIRQNSQRFAKEILGSKPTLGKVDFEIVSTRIDQAEKIVRSIQELRSVEPLQEKCPIAVLVRVRSSITAIEQMLLREELPFFILGGGFWYERLIPRGLLNLLLLQRLETARKAGKLSSERYPIYLETLRAVCNFPNRTIPKESINRLASSLDESSSALVDLVDRHWPIHVRKRKGVEELLEVFDLFLEASYQTPRELVDFYSGRSRLLEALTSEDASRASELQLELQSFRDFSGRFRDGKDLLNEAKRQRKINQSGLNEKNIDPRAIVIQTIHLSKGLAWDHVFIPDINYTIIPWRRVNWNTGKPMAEAADLEGERRLFYVALTRAKKSLSLYSVINQNDNSPSSQPSEFMEEIPLSWLEEKWGIFDDAWARKHDDPSLMNAEFMKDLATELGFLPAFLFMRNQQDRPDVEAEENG